MPHSKSAEKRERQNERRRLRNKARYSATKTQIKKFLSAAETGSGEQVQKEYRLAVSAVDKAAKAGIFHKNRAGHMKSGLAASLKKSASSEKE